MKGGVLGVVDGTFDAVADVHETVERDGETLERALEVDRVFSLPSGGMAFAGRAAAERVDERTAATIDDGGISVSERRRIETDHTQFVGVPGEFVVVGSGDGTFAFDLIGAETGTGIERATLDLDGFLAGHERATPWKASFKRRGDAEVSGVFHGADLRTDPTVQQYLDDRTLNQLGLRYEYAGDELLMTATASGYVELYQPTGYDAGGVLEYLTDEIAPHVE